MGVPRKYLEGVLYKVYIPKTYIQVVVVLLVDSGNVLYWRNSDNKIISSTVSTTRLTRKAIGVFNSRKFSNESIGNRTFIFLGELS